MKAESYVVKSNQLIESKGRMNTLEQKLFATMVSMIQKEDVDFKEYEMKISEIAHIINVNYPSFYEDIHSAAESLLSKTTRIKEGKKTISVSFISSLTSNKSTGSISMRFDPNLKPYLLDLQNRYTQYQLKNVCQLTSSHSIRIYELLKQYEKIGYRDIGVSELKEFLGIENSYAAFKDFEKRVLAVAKEEINAFTDLNIDYKKLKTGKAITSISFLVARKLSVINGYSDIDIHRLRVSFDNMSYQFSDTQLIELYELACYKYEDNPIEYLKRQYQYMIENKRARNKFAYLKKAVSEDYANAAGWIKFESLELKYGS